MNASNRPEPPLETLISLGSFIVYVVLQIFVWMLIAWAIMTWLVQFNVLNRHSQFVRTVLDTLERIFTPLLRPIRRLLPDFGGIDLSPMVLVLLVLLIQQWAWPAVVRNLVA